jgi:hypothetical protein
MVDSEKLQNKHAWKCKKEQDKQYKPKGIFCGALNGHGVKDTAKGCAMQMMVSKNDMERS